MKKVALLFATFVSVFSVSCSKLGIGPTKDPNLGEFQAFEVLMDMSQKNKYNESRFYGDWVLSKVTLEKYQDGVLESTEDDHGFWDKDRRSFRKGHIMYHHDGLQGSWLYSHNWLLWKQHDGGYYGYEVSSVKSGVLVLKYEDFPVGGHFLPYNKDKSGEHYFRIMEYHSE